MISENSSGEVLGLRFERETGACALQPLVEQLLLLIRQQSTDAKTTRERTKLGQRLESMSRTLLDRGNRKQASELTGPILEVCEKLLEPTTPAPTNNEVAAAITLVREAVASMDGVEQTLQRLLAESVDKFDALRNLDSIQQIKMGLSRQVDALRQASSRREMQWRRQTASVERKIRSLEAQLAETRLEARHDALTGLVNRRSVEASFRLFQDVRRPFVLALFDVDDFKKINDSYGHVVGDTALKSIATMLQSTFRSHDVVGRFGGDEFIVMMVDVALTLAERRLMQILQNLRNIPSPVENGPKITLTCGVSEFSAGDSFETLVARVDQALYDAKQAGKNRLGIKAVPFIRDLQRRAR
jgi:diguanylate cyclase (GGDEF)-like protein